jgi:hypothetical protein
MIELPIFQILIIIVFSIIVMVYNFQVNRENRRISKRLHQAEEAIALLKGEAIEMITAMVRRDTTHPFHALTEATYRQYLRERTTIPESHHDAMVRGMRRLGAFDTEETT